MMGDQGGYGFSIGGIRHSDPHAKEIIDGSYDVTIYSRHRDLNKWSKTVEQASLFVYSRNVEPTYVLLLLDHTLGSTEVTLFTADTEFHYEAPFLFCIDEVGGMRCIDFKTTDDCNRVYQRIQQIMQSIHLISQPTTSHVGLLSMLAEAQGVFDDSDQPNRVNEAIPSHAMTTPAASNVMSVSDAASRNEENKTVPPFESITPEPANIFDSSNLATDQLNTAIPLSTRSAPGSSEVMSICDAGNEAMKHVPHHVKKALPTNARPVPASSYILSASNPAMKRVHKAMPSLSRTIPASSSNAMSVSDAVNAAMRNDSYKAIEHPSYSSITPESTQLTDFSKVAIAPKKRMLPAPIRVDQIEKRQRIAASLFQNADTVGQTASLSHHLPQKMVHSTWTQQETENSALDKGTSSSNMPPFHPNPQKTTNSSGPKLYSPLMYIERNQSAKGTVTSTLLASMENISEEVIRVNESETQGRPESLTQQLTMTKPSRNVLINRKQLSNETGAASMVQTDKENISSEMIRTNKLGGHGKPEPLTQNQLLQAISYIIKTDNGFVHKLHEAYLQSFTEMLAKRD